LKDFAAAELPGIRGLTGGEVRSHSLKVGGQGMVRLILVLFSPSHEAGDLFL